MTVENVVIFLVLVGVGYGAYKLWKSKKRNPTDPNFVDPGVSEVDSKDKRQRSDEPTMGETDFGRSALAKTTEIVYNML